MRPALTFFCEVDEAGLARLMATPGLARDLAALGASLSMACLDRSPTRARAIRELTAHGVAVNAWLVLPREAGYFATADNAAAVGGCYAELAGWARAEGLALGAIGLDVEMDIVHMEALASRPWRVAAPALRGAVARTRARAAVADYAALVARIHDDGWRVETYQLPPVLDGRAAGSSLLGRAFGMLEVAGDREVLMLYSSALPGGAAWLASYAPHADAIGLGVTGGGTVVVPRMGWEDLARDLAVAAVTGRPLYLFSLEGCVERGWLPRLADFAWPEVGSPPPPVRGRRLVDSLRATARRALALESALARRLSPHRVRGRS